MRYLFAFLKISLILIGGWVEYICTFFIGFAAVSNDYSETPFGSALPYHHTFSAPLAWVSLFVLLLSFPLSAIALWKNKWKFVLINPLVLGVIILIFSQNDSTSESYNRHSYGTGADLFEYDSSYSDQSSHYTIERDSVGYRYLEQWWFVQDLPRLSGRTTKYYQLWRAALGDADLEPQKAEWILLHRYSNPKLQSH